MRRLYLQIYATLLASLLLFALLSSLAFWLVADTPREQDLLREAGVLAAELLPAAERPETEAQSTLERLSGRLEADFALLAHDGRRIAAAGAPLDPPSPAQLQAGLRRRHERGTVLLPLPDGRWLLVRHGRSDGPHLWTGLGAIALLGLAIALGAWPVVRRLTRRLEQLENQAKALARGQLHSRVDARGHDEVAQLAHAFNHAAERIEQLVDGQRQALASASHELRTPLTRIRVAIELMEDELRPELRTRIERDIAELDELIGELLLASRLDAVREPLAGEPVDLLALLAEECARLSVPVAGRSLTLHGDPRLLRRLIRNLLENARRHAAANAVEARVEAADSGDLRVVVEDRGPGVPAGERERIFEPFYRPQGMREDGGGVGLGLALVRRIAELHGGRARCLEREGGGCRFEVDLPAAAASAD